MTAAPLAPLQEVRLRWTPETAVARRLPAGLAQATITAMEAGTVAGHEAHSGITYAAEVLEQGVRTVAARQWLWCALRTREALLGKDDCPVCGAWPLRRMLVEVSRQMMSVPVLVGCLPGHVEELARPWPMTAMGRRPTVRSGEPEGAS